MLFQVNRIRATKKEQEVFYDGVASFFDPLPPVHVGAKEEEGEEQVDVSYVEEPNEGLSEFQLRVRRILRVGPIQNVNRNPHMYGRTTESSTNKYIKFVADSGAPVAFIPQSIAERNKLEIFPADPDEASYEAATGPRMSVIGQTHMFIKFKTMKTTKT